ncbi:MAG: hypothetical protein IPL49_18075 [Saprospirales bacterium]|nr:hypothetical protein [Saprospirales bacterium]
MDSQGSLWASTNDKLFRAAHPNTPGKAMRFEEIPSSDIPRGDLPYNQSCALFPDSSGGLWIGSGKAITRVTLKKSGGLSFQPYFFPDDYQMSRINNLDPGSTRRHLDHRQQWPSLGISHPEPGL